VEGIRLMSKNKKSSGFTVVSILVITIVLLAIAGVSWRVLASNKNTTDNHANNKQTNLSSNNSKQTTDPYAGWKTYKDIGYPLASGVSIKYPSDWQVKVGNNKAFAWVIEHKETKGSVNVRTIYLKSTMSPKQEWDNCPSADACGPAIGETEIDEKSSTINGLDSYSVKMQSSGNNYYSTVIKSNKVLNDGTVAFVEFILNSEDTILLNAYKQIVSSANFLID
jgi:Tfp pilus assembly protein PilV